MTLPATSGGGSYHEVIVRAAQDPNFDVDKLERLVAMQEAREQRNADQQFNDALSAAEAEMEPIATDANNPQTRSRYATHAGLDGAIRKIYTSHGFGISFTTQSIGDPNWVRIIGMLSNGLVMRPYEYDSAIETTGAKGTQYTTRQWAKASAVTYGKRQILIMMFNLAISDGTDDDGSRAGAALRRQPYRARPQPDVTTTRSMEELIDPETGEVVDHLEPFTIEMNEGSTWAQFIEPLQRYILQSATIAEYDGWKLKNQDMLLKLHDTKPQLYRLFEKNIERRAEELTNALGPDAGRS